MTVDTAQIDALFRDQKNFAKLVSSPSFMQSLQCAIGDFINLKALLALRFLEECSVKQLAEYYEVGPGIIEDWLDKIYLMAAVLIRKNIIRFD